MVTVLNDKKTIAKASRGLISDYFTVDTTGKKDNALAAPSSLFDLKDLMEDPTFNAQVNTIVDKIMRGSFQVYKRKSNGDLVRDASKEYLLLRNYKFFEVLRQLFLNVLVYRNSFLEIEWSGSYPKAFHLLEAPEMRINVTPHGEILGYTQVHSQGVLPVTYSKPKEVFFDTDEVIHIAPSKLSTNPWGYIDTRAIKNIVEYKQFVEAYLFELFKDNKFRDAFFIKQAASIDQIENVINMIKQGRVFPEKDLVFEGEIEQKQLRSTEIIKDLRELINGYREMIREFFRVPPLMAGDVGQSNKSSGEFQVRYAFENTIASWQDIVAHDINYKLFPTLGMGQYVLKFPSTDRAGMDTALKMAVNLKGLGYNSETIHQYLISEGLSLPASYEFDEVQEMGQEAKQTFQNMNAKSREASTKKIEDKNSIENKTTRVDQIEGK